jgi:hypothetical protein
MFALAAATALIVAALAAVPAAQASTLYACVTKSGAAHLYTKKPKKCASKKEKLVSWNTVGPAGKNGTNGTNGANGTNGTNGSNGAVAGYFVSGYEKSTLITESEGTVLEKTLPAGHYLITAKAVIAAEGTKFGLIGAKCSIINGATQIDASYLDMQTAEFESGDYFAALPLTMLGTVTLTAPTKITLECQNYFDKANASVLARESDLMAVQTSSIG